MTLLVFVFLQLRIEASDHGSPPQSGIAILYITVIRNLNAPVFAQEMIRVDIKDNTAPGTSVATVSAADADREVCIYYLLNMFSLYNQYYLYGLTLCYIHVDLL